MMTFLLLPSTRVVYSAAREPGYSAILAMHGALAPPMYGNVNECPKDKPIPPVQATSSCCSSCVPVQLPMSRQPELTTTTGFLRDREDDVGPATSRTRHFLPQS